MGKAIITVQMLADASISPNIGWFEGGKQEDIGEDEVCLADAPLARIRSESPLTPFQGALRDFTR
jgi:hypothetical protein